MKLMQKITLRRALVIALLSAAPLGASAQEQLPDFDKSVFEFQSKMANNGSAKAQYYLAQMYEQGRGTKADPEMAKMWYEKSRKNGYRPEGQPTSN